MEYFDQEKPPEIPLDLFQCPICGAQVCFVEINEYETETGKITDIGFHVSCTTEPDFDDPDYDDWLNSHFSTPYVDWLPLEAKIYKWLSAGFRLRLPTPVAADKKACRADHAKLQAMRLAPKYCPECGEQLSCR